MDKMSARIRNILEVLDHVAERRANPSKPDQVRKARIAGTKKVAGRHGIWITSVRDSFVRQIGLSSVGDYDKLIIGWLRGNPEELRKRILEHVSSRPQEVDKEAVDSFFHRGRLILSDNEQFKRDLEDRKSGLVDPDRVAKEYERRFQSGDYSVPDAYSQQQVRIGHDL